MIKNKKILTWCVFQNINFKLTTLVYNYSFEHETFTISEQFKSI